jgi:hypothetical protein
VGLLKQIGHGGHRAGRGRAGEGQGYERQAMSRGGGGDFILGRLAGRFAVRAVGDDDPVTFGGRVRDIACCNLARD